jgi:mono/diheme cytochrome c family protein/outer membrane protein assembly factor BamB
MIQKLLAFAGALALVTGIIVGSASTVDGAGPSQRAAKASRPGLFTQAQAAAGEALYAKSCASCHGAALAGGTAPPLSGNAFRASWGDPRVTLDDLFFLLRTTMPPRASSSLSPQDHAAVFAYILKANGYAPGGEPLAVDAPQLKVERLQSVPAGGRPVARTPPPAFIPAAAGAMPAGTGPDQATLNASSRSTDWLVHGHDYSGTRFSPLDDINTTTASRLAPACVFQVGERDNFQTGPIVHNGTMYVTTMTSTIALDAATCRVKWRHKWQSRDDEMWQRNRGVYTNSIIALDVRTGTLRWHRQLVPNDSHDWDVTHAAPLFTATINGATRRLVATVGKDGVLRALDRDTHKVLWEAPVTTRENARGASDDDADARVSRRAWRQRVERAGI